MNDRLVQPIATIVRKDVRIGAALEQQPRRGNRLLRNLRRRPSHDVDQGSFTERRPGIDVRAQITKQLDHGSVGTTASRDENRAPVLVGATRELGNAHENVAGARFLSRARAPRTRWGLAKPDPLAGGLARFHGYLAMAEAFILLHLPPAFLHCFFVPASETSDPSAPRQWRLAFANAAGEAARANAAIRANFIQLLLGRMCLLAILARALGLASIELARTVGGAWPLAERL